MSKLNVDFHATSFASIGTHVSEEEKSFKYSLQSGKWAFRSFIERFAYTMRRVSDIIYVLISAYKKHVSYEVIIKIWVIMKTMKKKFW